MSVDPMARLAAANPVTDSPSVKSPERVRRLIEDQALQMPLGVPGRRPTRLPRRALIAVALAACASVTGVLLTAGSSGPGVNIAAAAYAATSPQSGVVEAVFMARIFRGSQAGGTLRQREWNDAAPGLRREQDTTTGPYGDTRETHVLEMAFAPGRWETWSSGAEANVITRMRTHSLRALKVTMAFGGIALDGVQGIQLYRKLYREGLMRLIGKERHQGRSLWKLESHPVGSQNIDHTRLVVLVDPKSFLPVSERQIDVAVAGHPTVVESNLVSYRHLPGGKPDSKLFDLARQHPAARVLTRTMTQRFVPMHRHRQAAKRR
jgi:hypothetical protein